MNKEINAEGGEVILRNGDNIAIIPKDKRKEALGYLDKNDHSALSNMISRLPMYNNYAEDGTMIPDNNKPDISNLSYSDTNIPEPIVNTTTPVSNVASSLTPVKRKRPFTTSVAYKKFKDANKKITEYDLGSKGYGDTNKSDCSGGVCRYIGIDETTAKMNMNAYNIYKKYTKDRPNNKTEIGKEVDGTGMYFYNPNGTNHIGIVNVDDYGTKVISHVSSNGKGYTVSPYKEYIDKLIKRGYEINPFNIDDVNINE